MEAAHLASGGAASTKRLTESGAAVVTVATTSSSVAAAPIEPAASLVAGAAGEEAAAAGRSDYNAWWRDRARKDGDSGEAVPEEDAATPDQKLAAPAPRVPAAVDSESDELTSSQPLPLGSMPLGSRGGAVRAEMNLPAPTSPDVEGVDRDVVDAQRSAPPPMSQGIEAKGGATDVTAEAADESTGPPLVAPLEDGVAGPTFETTTEESVAIGPTAEATEEDCRRTVGTVGDATVEHTDCAVVDRAVPDVLPVGSDMDLHEFNEHLAGFEEEERGGGRRRKGTRLSMLRRSMVRRSRRVFRDRRSCRSRRKRRRKRRYYRSRRKRGRNHHFYRSCRGRRRRRRFCRSHRGR